MKIAYANAYYVQKHKGGGYVHVGQFVENMTALGHELWGWPENKHPDVQLLPSSYFRMLRQLRQMDALYVRMERTPPSVFKWGMFPYRQLYGFQKVIWEFNTTLEYGLLQGQSEAGVAETKAKFRQNGKGCDLAVCVSEKLAEYVREELGIMNTVVIPNGSDPDLFNPNAPIATQLEPFVEKFNIVWVGSLSIPWNDFDMLSVAAQALHNSDLREQIHFHVIGDKGDRSLPEDLPNLHIWSAVPYHELSHWFAAMDVGLCLYKPGSADYSSPLKFFDYLASELVVLSTPHEQICEILGRLGQGDLMLAENDPHILVERIMDLYQKWEHYQPVGKAGRELMIDNYTWRHGALKTVEAIEGL